MFSNQSLRQRFAFLQHYSAIALAVSGGADSLALLHLIARWQQNLKLAKVDKQKSQNVSKIKAVTRPEIHVLSVDHGLRKQAGQECAFVMAEAKALGFAGKVLKWEGEKPSSAIQETARKARYDLCANYCSAHNIPILLTAHQLEDQVETFLMRLARGGGLDSLAAISPMRCHQGLILARPLLDVPKQELKDYLQSLNKVWMEDPSNQDTNYERIQLRQNLSALEAINVPLEAVGRSVARLGRTSQALDQMAERLYCDKVAFFALPVFFFKNTVLDKEPEELVIRLFRLIFEKMHFAQALPELKQVENMVEGLKQGDFRKITLSGCEVLRSTQGVYIYREVGRVSPKEGHSLPSRVWVTWDNRFEVMLCSHVKKPIFARPLGEQDFAPFRKVLKERVDLPFYVRKMPASVGGSLLSFWQGKTLCAVPDLDYYAGGLKRDDILVRSLILPVDVKQKF